MRMLKPECIDPNGGALPEFGKIDAPAKSERAGALASIQTEAFRRSLAKSMHKQ
jgi:hypothetical protein